MKNIQINYKTQTETRNYAGKTFVLETIRNLDEAIDDLCAQLDNKDPFAEELCPYFGVLWPAAEALAEHLTCLKSQIQDKTILELGSGLGLPSLVATHLGANVLTTDYHPHVETFYRRNCVHSSITPNYRQLNWRDPNTNLEKYDYVIGSDILYESRHPLEVAKGVIRFLKTNGTIILADPGRSYLQNFVTAMEELEFIPKLIPYSIKDQEVFVFEFQKG
jgi:predicted nicotinamide N-methyase